MKWLACIVLTAFLIVFQVTPRFSLGEYANSFRELNMKGLNFRVSNENSEFKYSGFIKSQAENLIRQWNMAGMSMAVVKNGKLVYAHGFGLGDKENEQPVSPGNLFRIASVSKLITAVGIMKLVEDGKLSLESKVFGPSGILKDTLFSNVRDKRLYQVTVRHLLTHSGGWSQAYGDPAFNSLKVAELVGDTPPATIQTYYKFISSRRLHFTPGTRTSYSNMGYMFLGSVIEAVSGKKYEDYIRNEILIPHGILDMYIGRSSLEDRRLNEVKYYDQPNGEAIPSFENPEEMAAKPYGGNPIELLGPAGGWIASSIELAKLVVLIDGWSNVKDILPQHLINQMVDDTKFRGPLGWKTITKNGDWIRTGSMAGTSAMIKRQADGTSWVIIFNASNWKGSRFPVEIDAFMRRIENKVDAWPRQDLFSLYNLN